MASVRIEFLDEFVKLCEELLRERPKDAKVLRQTSLTYRRLGDVWIQSRESKRAEEAYRKAQQVQERLVADFPERPEYQNELAQIYAQQAKALQGQRRFAEAQASSRKAIDVEDRLAAQAPKNATYRELAARYRFHLGNQLEEAGEPGKAEPLYREAFAQQEKLVADSPKRASAHHDLATTAASLGLLVGDANTAEAERILERMLQAARQAKQLTIRYTQRLRECYTDFDRFLKKQGKHERLTRLAAELCRDFPDSQMDSYNAACFMADAAKVVQEDRQLPTAERQKLVDEYAKRAIELLRQSFNQGNNDPDYLDKDHDLDPLRGRADYQMFVAELDKRFPGRALTPDREYTAIVQAYDNSKLAYDSAMERARTVAEKKRAEELKPRVEETAQRLLQLAMKHRQSPAAADALAWILENGEPLEAGKAADAVTRYREEAFAILERDYLQKPEFANVCQRLAKTPQSDVEKLMRTAWEQHAQRDVRALAGYALALSLAKQAERAQARSSSEAEELARKAEQQLERIIQEYAGVPTDKGTLGEAAKAKLYEFRYLSVGRVAAEIEGEDFEGKPFKLSDYRGNVVVLDFWANWCGFCRQMYPHQRELVQRLKGRPFALLGVNNEPDKDEVVRAIKKERLTWRSWWDGGGTADRITKQWQIDALPRVYVLDAKGVIRYKHEGVIGNELDDVVNKLLAEQEAQTRTGKN